MRGRVDFSQLNPTIVAQIRYPQQPTPKEKTKYVGRTVRQVRTCTSCELSKHVTPVPMAWTKSPAKFVVVGEVPAPDDVAPFDGSSGKLLKALLKSVGFDPREILYANTVSCWANTEGKIRAPTASETLACRGNLLAQVEAGYTPFVLLVGGRALRAFRSDLTATHHHGEVFVWNDLYVVMPILNPSTILRGQGGGGGIKSLIKEDLARWMEIVTGDDDPLSWIGKVCSNAKCKGDAAMWDRDAVPYCAKHWAKEKSRWEVERMKWQRDPMVQLEIW